MNTPAYTPNSIVLPCLDFECHFVSADENISFTSEEYSISDIVDMDAYEYYNYYNSRSSKFLQDSEDIRISFSGWFETAGSSCCLEFTLWNNEDSTIPLGQTIAYRTNGANLADRFLSYISEETYDTPVSSNHTDEYNGNSEPGGTYVARITSPTLDDHADVVCEVYDCTQDSFTLHFCLYTYLNTYDLEPVVCTYYSDGSFVSDYAIRSEYYTVFSWESTPAQYFRLGGIIADNGQSLIINEASEYRKQYDGTMTQVQLTADSDGSRTWLGYFNHIAAYGYSEEVVQTLAQIPNSNQAIGSSNSLPIIGGGLYVSHIKDTFYQCSISNVTNNGFDLDFAISAKDHTFSLNTANCYFDFDGEEVPVQGELVPFYSDCVSIYNQTLTDDNRDYWNERAYLLMGYFEPDGSAIYITVVEYLCQEDGSLVENENVDYGSWVHYFDGDNGAHRPQPAYWRM